ncbi:MAG: hypothetical protein AB1704_38615 [Pseudomonadota bacterium]|jgi:hypothetical protein|uniref:hypothetical protein n=1 Tax=Burkholderiaceae TaxID=119060 RepID=UPI0010F6E441|nr:hypothetical protein [Burkholderia sp. 4M9327F10]
MNEDLHLDLQAGSLATRSPEPTSRSRSLRKRCGIALLMAALSAVVAITATAGGEANAFALPVPLTEAPPSEVPFTAVPLTKAPLTDELPPHVQQAPRPLALDSASPPCGLHYAALLDLAELARHYGKGSGAYRHAFGSVTNQLDACRSDERYAAASPGPADTPRAGAPVDSYD